MKKRWIILFGVLAIGWIGHRVAEVHKRRQGVLAVLHVYGPIRTSLSTSAWGRSDAEDVARRLNRISEDKDVKAVVLQINSPGGPSAPSRISTGKS